MFQTRKILALLPLVTCVLQFVGQDIAWSQGFGQPREQSINYHAPLEVHIAKEPYKFQHVQSEALNVLNESELLKPVPEQNAIIVHYTDAESRRDFVSSRMVEGTRKHSKPIDPAWAGHDYDAALYGTNSSDHRLYQLNERLFNVPGSEINPTLLGYIRDVNVEWPEILKKAKRRFKARSTSAAVGEAFNLYLNDPADPLAQQLVHTFAVRERLKHVLNRTGTYEVFWDGFTGSKITAVAYLHRTGGMNQCRRFFL